MAEQEGLALVDQQVGLIPSHDPIPLILQVLVPLVAAGLVAPALALAHLTLPIQGLLCLIYTYICMYVLHVYTRVSICRALPVLKNLASQLSGYYTGGGQSDNYCLAYFSQKKASSGKLQCVTLLGFGVCMVIHYVFSVCFSRSSYSSSRRSYSASPHSSRIRKEHALLQKGSHSDPRSKPLSSKVPSHRRYPPSSQWYEAHPPPSYTSSRSPLRTRKVYPPPPHPTSRSSRVYNDEYPPAKRRPPTDYPEYRRGPPPSGRHHRIHSPPPPPPPPALKRKERVVRRMRRSPLRSPPHSSRLAYGRGPPSPPPRRRPRRHSFSPPPPPRPTRAPRPSRGLVSDHIPSRPSSRDFRSLCGPPIHVREHLRRRTPERRGPRPSDPSSARSSYKPASTGLSRSRWMERDRQREGRPLVRSRVGSVSDRARRSITESSRKEKLERYTCSYMYM